MILPDCMMPDGAEPCKSWTELRAGNERLLAALSSIQEYGGYSVLHLISIARAAVESEVVRQLSGHHEANGLQHDNERLRAAFKEIREISTKWGNSIPWKEGERIAEICASLDSH